MYRNHLLVLSEIVYVDKTLAQLDLTKKKPIFRSNSDWETDLPRKMTSLTNSK